LVRGEYGSLAMRPEHRKRKASGTQGKNSTAGRKREGAYFHYRELLDALEIGVACVSERGIIRYSNPRFGDMVAAPPFKSLTGTNLRSFLSGSSWRDLDMALRRSAGVPSEGQLQLDVVSGPKRMIRVSFVPIPSAEYGPLIGIVATEVTRLMETAQALRDSEASVQNLSARLLRVQDEERRHMARDLHDTIGQELAIAVMRVEQIAKEVSTGAPNVQEELAECSEWLRKIESEIRTLSYVLHPPLLDQIGLVPALKWYIEGFSKRSGLNVQIDVRSKIPRLNVEEETALFRIVQESLTNVLRHSGSPEAYVRIGLENDSLCVSIEDKGQGIKRDRANEPKAPLGVGIAGMRGRLSLVQGTLDIQSDEQGTKVNATVPVRRADYKSVSASESAAAPARPMHHAQQPVAQGRTARILVADDHEIARRGIRDLFRDEPELEICGEAQDGVEALAKVNELHPDLLILDLSMPKMGGFSVANHLRRTNPSLKILVYSTHSHPDIERMARTAGCRGCVHKANAARDLVRGARAILRGGEFYECDIARSQPA